MPENAVERQGIAKGQSLAEFRQTVLTLRDRFLPYHDGLEVYVDNADGKSLFLLIYLKISRIFFLKLPLFFLDSFNLRLPPWLCQPYVRIPPEEHLRKLADKQNKADEVSIYLVSNNLHCPLIFL